MPSITTRAELRACKRLKFCYACGLPFGLPGDSTDRNEDHVPPKRLFDQPDRDPPLKLPTHVPCNNLRSAQDERIGQWMSQLYRPDLRPESLTSLRVQSGVLPGTEVPMHFVDGLRLRETIAFWIRGFHAALYSQPTPMILRCRFLDPFLCSTDRVSLDAPRPQDVLFVDMIKQQRRAGRMDVLECNNGKCRYECVWPNFDDGTPFCLFALNIYDWGKSARTGLPLSISCAGFFFTPALGVPTTATRATSLVVPVPNFEPLDAFGA